jgi:transcriptional regulator with XRE-family HTH domain
MELRYCCEECGEGLIHLGSGTPPTHCEDCIPQVGAGSRLLGQFAANLRRLQHGAGIKDASAIGELAGLSGVSEYFVQPPIREPGIAAALRLAFALGGSVDDLTDRIFWHPGEFATREGGPRAGVDRLAGFFQVLAPNVDVFESPGLPAPVSNRRKAAQIFGRNVRDARARRQLTQATLGERAGLSKDAMTLIERGITETTTTHLFGLARALHLAPAALIDGMYWTPPASAGLSRTKRALPDRDRSRRRFTRLRGDQCQETMMAGPALQEQGDEISAGTASAGAIATRLGANVRNHRRSARLSLRQAGEAAEIDFSYWSKLENGYMLPQLNLLVKIAATVNVRCGRLVAGIGWSPDEREFLLSATEEEEPLSEHERLGRNALAARRRLGVYQHQVAERAGMRRSEIAEIEGARRPFRIFAVVKLAAALELDFSELLAGVADWSVRPLPAPEFAQGEPRPTKAERDDELVQLWREGRSLNEIGDSLGLESATVGHYICDLRDAGVQLPYRRPPRGAVEVAKRLRRARSAAGTASPTRRPA